MFETTVTELQQEPDINAEVNYTEEEKMVIDQVRAIKGFYSHPAKYVLVVSLLFVTNYLTEPTYIWAVWPALGWGIGIINHGLNAFEIFSFFGPEWERRQIEKRLGRKL